VAATGVAYGHYVGTTAMGNASNPLAVVDQQLRVRGANNLRVCDSGSIPVITNGNIHATVLMLAQRCAGYILNG